MRLLRNSKREQSLFNKLAEKFQSQEREGIHASDLLSPRLAYFRKTDPRPLTEDAVGYFATGTGHHMFMVELETGLVGESQEESYHSEEYGIAFSPDMAKRKAEFKTARFIKEPVTEAESIKMFEEYGKQCLVYAICSGVTKWNLYVLFIGLRQGMSILPPRLRCYTYIWDSREIEEGKEWINNTVNDLQVALKRGKFAKLPLCAEYKCYRWSRNDNRKIVCCEYFQTCKPGDRYKEWLKNEGEE